MYIANLMVSSVRVALFIECIQIFMCRKLNKEIYSHSLVSNETFLLLLFTIIAWLHPMDLCFNAITMNCSQNEENTIDGDLDSNRKEKENQMSWRWLSCNRLKKDKKRADEYFSSLKCDTFYVKKGMENCIIFYFWMNKFHPPLKIIDIK